MIQILPSRTISFVILLLLFSGLASAQVPEQKDSVSAAKTDTTSTQKKSDDEDGKRKDVIILYTGLNFNKLQVSSENYESSSRIGWHLGAAYRRGGFFYWQVGGRFNAANYNLINVNVTDTAEHSFIVSDLDIPITGGINLIPFVNRIVNVRLFLSAVPAFQLGVGDNELGIDKDHINGFNFYGQGGVGVDVFFLLVEAGYNYGFQDLLKNEETGGSNPGQVFVNLGFRF